MHFLFHKSKYLLTSRLFWIILILFSSDRFFFNTLWYFIEIFPWSHGLRVSKRRAFIRHRESCYWYQRPRKQGLRTKLCLFGNVFTYRYSDMPGVYLNSIRNITIRSSALEAYQFHTNIHPFRFLHITPSHLNPRGASHAYIWFRRIIIRFSVPKNYRLHNNIGCFY